MAITLNYLPSAGLVGGAAYQTGLAEALRQQQEQARAEQLHYSQLAEQQRQFDTTNQRQNQQFAEGQYQFDVGQQDQAQKFGEGQRQFDAETQLKQQQLADARQAEEFNRQIADHKDKLARYGMFNDAAQQQMAIEGRLAGEDLQGQYGLADQQLQNQARFGAEQMQQQGLGNRQFDEQRFKEMGNERNIVLKSLQKLYPEERQQVVDQFNQKWGTAENPNPLMEMPQKPLADYENPEKIYAKAMETDPTVPWYFNSKGELVAPRNGGKSKQQMQIEHQNALDLAAANNQHKSSESEIKATEKEHDTFMKYQDSQQALAHAEDLNAQTQRHKEDDNYAETIKNLTALQKTIADAAVPKVDQEGVVKPAPDMSEVKKTVAKYEQFIADYEAKREAEDANDPFSAMNKFSQEGQPDKMPYIDDPAGIVMLLKDNQLKENDWVKTPKGPRQLTAAVIAKLMGGT